MKKFTLIRQAKLDPIKFSKENIMNDFYCMLAYRLSKYCDVEVLIQDKNSKDEYILIQDNRFCIKILPDISKYNRDTDILFVRAASCCFDNYINNPNIEVKAFYCACGIPEPPVNGFNIIFQSRIMDKKDKITHHQMRKSCNHDIFRPLNIPKKYDIIYVSNMTNPVKNHSLLFDVVKKFKLKAVCVGIRNKEVEELAEGLDVTFTGFLPPEKVNKYINESKVGISCTSTTEAPRIILEYMAAGIPIVAHSDEESSVVYINRETGLLSDGDDFSNAVEKLLKTYSTFDTRKYFMQHFRINVLAKYFLNIFDKKYGCINKQLPMLREYITEKGGRYKILTDAAISLGRVTIDKDFSDTTKSDDKTFFKEIKVAPPILNGMVKEYVNRSKDFCTYMSPEKFIDLLTKVVVEGWESTKFHIIFHSSGYDSRLLSYILKKLLQKNGEKWLGDILFICWEPEGTCFKRIMKWGGWSKKQYYIYQEGMTTDYRAELIEFDNVHRWVNASVGPIQPVGPSIVAAKRDGLIPDDRKIHVMAAWGVDEFCKAHSLINKQKKYKETYYRRFNMGFRKYDNPVINIMISLWLYPSFNPTYDFDEDIPATWSSVECDSFSFPFADVRIIESLVSKEFIKKQVRSQLPISLGNLLEGEGGDGTWANQPAELSKKVRKKTANDFNNSWYNKNISKLEYNIFPSFNNHSSSLWREYVLASMCEYLIKKGVEINYEHK